MPYIKRETKQGFTFIEMLIVVGIVGLLLPVLFSIIFTVIRQQTKVYALAEVKRQGDFILNTITTTIKNNALSAYTMDNDRDFPPDESNIVCSKGSGADDSGDLPRMAFKDKLGSFFALIYSGDQIVSRSSGSVPAGNLLEQSSNTNLDVKVTSFTISCVRSTFFSPPIITVSYDVQIDPGSGRSEETALLHYQTNVNIRSF